VTPPPPVVVGYDGTPAGEAALGRALEEVAASGGKLVVVSVSEMPLEVEGPMSFGTLGDGPAATLPLVEPPEIEGLQAAARERIEAAGVEADYVWETGEPAGAIVREARDRGAAAIVVGKGHHSRLGRWLGTDTAAEVERAAGCPVIVVEP
jgi:nucleotide-binding universal stress UspA family protein